MAPNKHEAFALHTVNNEKLPGSSGSWRWECKYCGRVYTSSVTRLLSHVSKQGGQIAPCKKIPQEVADEVVHKYSLRHNMKGGASSSYPPSPTPPICTTASMVEEGESPAISSSGLELKLPNKEAAWIGVYTNEAIPHWCSSEGSRICQIHDESSQPRDCPHDNQLQPLR